LEKLGKALRGLDRPMTDKLLSLVGGCKEEVERGPPISKMGWIEEYVHIHYRWALETMEELDREIDRARREVASRRGKEGTSLEQAERRLDDLMRLRMNDDLSRVTYYLEFIHKFWPGVIGGGDLRSCISTGMVAKEMIVSLDRIDLEAREMLAGVREIEACALRDAGYDSSDARVMQANSSVECLEWWNGLRDEL
jgi:hypothetical protein